MVTQFRRVYAQGVSDSTYSNNPKKNTYRTSISVVNTTSFGAANTTYGNMTGSSQNTVPDAPILHSLTSRNQGLLVTVIDSYNGGSPITDYQYSVDGGITFTSASTSTSPFMINGLTNGTPYSVVIRAINIIGSSNSSNSLTETPSIELQSFTTVGTTTWTAPDGVTSVEYLVVGGGGGGGNGYDNAGGGGGGGDGGIGGANERANNSGTDGSQSVFGSIVSLGGESGKGSRTGGVAGIAQNLLSDPPTAPTGGSGSGGGFGGKGGGGANSDGTSNSGTTGGSGGNGISSSLSGTSVTYGGGGDGANAGVANGGGNDGGANTGTGGDAGGSASSSSVGGGNGQAGIVVLVY